MGNTLEFVDDEEKAGGRRLKPISISNKDLQLPSFLKDWNISSKGLLPSMAETFRTHACPLLLKYTVSFSSMGNTPEFVDDEEIAGGRRLKPISISDKDLQLPSFLKERHISSMKIVETELLDSWLVKLLSREDDESIMADACWTVACIACERCDCELWDHVKEKLFPRIVDGLFYTTTNIRLVKAAVYVILKITEYGSSYQIDGCFLILGSFCIDLVVSDLVEMGGLKYLVSACSIENEDLLEEYVLMQLRTF